MDTREHRRDIVVASLMVSQDSGTKKEQIWIWWIRLAVQGVPKLVFASIINSFNLVT